MTSISDYLFTHFYMLLCAGISRSSVFSAGFQKHTSGIIQLIKNIEIT